MVKPAFTFFGTDGFAVFVLEELQKEGFVPSLVVAVPDKPQGRNKEIVSSPVKVWAEKHKIHLLQPEKLDDSFVTELKKSSWDLFIVASYGKIIPQKVLDIPQKQTLNIHPSLLPKFRGPSPLENAILYDEKTGVTIMRLDEKMDHGPIVAQEEFPIPLPVRKDILEEKLARQGGKLLASSINNWLTGKIKEITQDETGVTYTKKITKEDGLIDLDKPKEAYRKILAFIGWPGAYFFTERNGKKIRVIVTDAALSETGELVITKVKPEGKSDMSYESFLRGTQKK